MEFSQAVDVPAREIVDLFTATFTASEGAAEGSAIGALADDLLTTTPDGDLFTICAKDGAALVGCIIFSRLTYAKDNRTVFVLGPVAVGTDRQGEGIGQRLLNRGLAELRAAGVDVAVTYGDPGYYAKVGFRQISEETAAAPFKLQYPHGWLAQPLRGAEIPPLAGPVRCVAAFNKPEFW
jgi:predicted N-acetyltransferase YhbS